MDAKPPTWAVHLKGNISNGTSISLLFPMILTMDHELRHFLINYLGISHLVLFFLVVAKIKKGHIKHIELLRKS